jgi:hypothetical protein
VLFPGNTRASARLWLRIDELRGASISLTSEASLVMNGAASLRFTISNESSFLMINR